MNSEDYRYTRHARRQMARRDVPEEAVEMVLVNYHTRRPAPVRHPAPAADIFIGAVDGRDLKVYVRRDSSPPLITTVVWSG